MVEITAATTYTIKLDDKSYTLLLKALGLCAGVERIKPVTAEEREQCAALNQELLAITAKAHERRATIFEAKSVVAAMPARTEEPGIAIGHRPRIDEWDPHERLS